LQASLLVINERAGPSRAVLRIVCGDVQIFDLRAVILAGVKKLVGPLR